MKENSNKKNNTKKVLEVKNLTVISKDIDGKKNILDNISFSVFQDQIVGIIGETGSGKTLTMLSVIDMLPDDMKIESGEIVFMGENIILSNKLKNNMSINNISMIFQNQRMSFSPVYKISSQMRDVVKVCCEQEADKKYIKKNIDNYCLELLKKVGFDSPKDIYSKYPFELSGGMLQRVNLSMVMAMSPKLLIADEPTTALDPETQNYILKLIKNYQQTLNNSMVIVTHDFSVVKKICTHVVVMKDGKIIEQGKVDSILKNPKHDYTKQLTETERRYF